MDPGLRFAGSTNGANSITAAKVVVHHPAGLHEGVADRGSDEGETALFQVLAHGFGFRRRDRQFPVMVGAAAVDDGFSSDKTPNITVEGAEFLADFEKGAGVVDGRQDLGAVAD